MSSKWLACIGKKANLRASNGLPSKYLPQVKANYPTALPNQFIPDNDGFWAVENYEAFLTERRKLIASGINDFLECLIADAPRPEPMDQTLKRLLNGGESEEVEFKSSFRWDYKENRKNKALEGVIAKAVAGFMNAKGGVLLIGIGPDRELLGLQNDYAALNDDQNRDGFEQKLIHVLMRRIGKDSATLVRLSFVEMNGKDVWRVRVEPSSKPVYVEDDGDVKF